jgi:hypothetical protein
MAGLNNVVNVALFQGGALLPDDNMNIVAIMTSERGFLSTAKRYALYNDLGSVAANFGTASAAYKAASVFFAQQPNPAQVGGMLVMGYYRATAETVAATAGVLRGAQLSEATVIDQLQKINNGEFDITVAGTLRSPAALDFRPVTTMADVVARIQAGLTGATVSYADQRIVITGSTTGAASTITFASSSPPGTFIGQILGIAAGTGATITQGAASVVLPVETPVDAVTALKAQVNIKGYTFINNPTDIESKLLATWGQANGVMGYDVFDEPFNLSVDPANYVWDIKLAGLTNYRMFYSKAGDRNFAVAAMAKVHIVNFDGENTAQNLNMKEFTAIVPDDLTQTEISAALRVGLSVYVPFKGGLVSKVLETGANDFADNRYNLIAFENSVQTAAFNLLGGTSTKIPQTTRGINQIIDTVEKVSNRFVRVGVFAAGEWASPDSFGDTETFKRSIREKGFYWLAGSLAAQSQANREARKSPVIQGAVKLAGAVNSIDIIVFVNK